MSPEPNAAALLRRQLTDIPDLYLEVSHYLTPGSAPADPDARHGTHSPAQPPIVPDVVDLLDRRSKDLGDEADADLGWNRTDGRRLGVLPTLGLWVSLAHAELDDLGQDPPLCCPDRQHTVAGECAWLDRYAETIMDLHRDFAGDVEGMWRDLRAACRTRDPYLPHCPTCGFRLEAQYAEGEATDRTPAWWRCTGCDRTFQHDAEIKRLALTQPPMTLRQIASMVGIPISTLHRWERDGRFMPVGRSSRGGKLFEIEHVKRAAERVRKTPGRAS